VKKVEKTTGRIPIFGGVKRRVIASPPAPWEMSPIKQKTKGRKVAKQEISHKKKGRGKEKKVRLKHKGVQNYTLEGLNRRAHAL